jgi:catechol 2,3-dioxygenase-like lactoylglutathione lyase family enzyme
MLAPYHPFNFGVRQGSVLAVLLCAGLVVVGGWHGRISNAEETKIPLETPRFHHLHLNVVDPDAELSFYTTRFQTTSRGDTVGLPALRSGPVSLLFTKVPARPSDGPQSAYWHFGWEVKSSRGSWQRYVDIGAQLQPLYTGDGGTVTFSGDAWPGILTKAQIPAAAARGVKSQAGGFGMLRGPSGELIEFSGDFPVERFYHVHMFQEDVFCAELWYQTHLNAPLSSKSRRGNRHIEESNCRAPAGEPSWPSPVPEGITRDPMAGVTLGDVDLYWYPRQGTRPLVSSKGQVMDHVGLAVKDLNAWHKKLQDEGVTVLLPPYALGTTRALMVEGPSHERLEFVEIK